jgi:hypothetical protein
MVRETLTLEGHLIDSDILRRVFDRVVEEGGEFEVQEFKVGARTTSRRSPASRCARATRRGSTASSRRCATWGATSQVADCRFAPAEQDGILPDDFYSTTNFDTSVRIDGRWLTAVDQKMDSALVLREGVPHCVKQGRCARARGSRCAARHPRAAARAQPRLRGLRLHVERRLGRGQQGDRDPRGGARDEARARGGGADRGGSRPGRRPLGRGARARAASSARAGWT